jgi:hypothetical protein
VHVMPQPPQLALSLAIVSRQLPLQQLCEPHGVPQPPQLFGSLVMSTHVFEQHVLAVPRHPLPQLPPPLSMGGPPVSFVVPVSFVAPVSLTPLVSGLVPESRADVSSATDPVAHPDADAQIATQTQAAGPTTRMRPSPAKSLAQYV